MGVNATAYTAIIPNLCTCGHNITSHPDPVDSSGTCLECALSANTTGNVEHAFIPNVQTNNHGSTFPNRDIFFHSDPNAYNVTATVPNPNYIDQIITTGPARPPNGQRAG